MAQPPPPPQRQYEGYTYPTDFNAAQAGDVSAGGGTYFGGARRPSPTPAPVAGTTGLVRRSNQHAGTGGAAPYQGSYGYFHGRGNSMELNSGYNSDAGSSASNALYMGGGFSGAGPSAQPPQPQHQEVVVGQGRHGTSSLEVSPGMHAADIGPRGRSFSGRQSPQLPPPPRGGPGIFQPSSEGLAGSNANSTLSSNSAMGPAPQTFLPSAPFAQSSPLSAVPNRRGPHPHQPQQPYIVPIPSGSPQRTEPSGATPPEVSFVTRNSPGAYAGSPVHFSGPRMPAMPGSAAGPGGLGAGGSGGGGGGAAGGFLSRLIAQVLPTLDEQGADGGLGVGGAGMGARAPVGERPAHQVRFGNPADDLPLLEELGVFPRHILDKARAVLNPFKTMSVDAAKDTDLAGPILFAFSLALLLSLRGKIQFSAIYGLFVVGVAFFKVLLSLMQPRGSAPLQFVVSTVGYGLLPTVLLALVRTGGSWLVTRRGVLPLTLLMIVWSAWCGTALVAKGLGMEEQRYLVLYPMFLFYAAFDAVTVF